MRHLLLAAALLFAACAAPTPPKAPEGPVILALGPEGGTPEALLVQFDTPVPEDATRWAWSLAPADEGQLTRITPTTLRFEPKRPLAPGLDYTFTLTDPRDRRTWTHRFQTPAFQLVELTAGPLASGRDQVTLTARFSDRVDPAAFVDHATWSLDGAAPSLPVDVVAGDAPDRLTVTVTDPSLRAGSRVQLRLDPGLPHRRGGRAPGATRAVAVGAAAGWRVLTAQPVETPQGYALRVLCDDEAAGGRVRRWDPVRGERVVLSHRCLPDAEAARHHLQVEPAVPFTVARDRLGFRLQGPFTQGSYTVRIRRGARTIDGGELAAASVHRVTVPRRSAQVRILADGRYLPRRLWGELPVQHINATALAVRIHHIPPHAVAAWLARHDEDPRATTADPVASATVPVSGAPDTPTRTVLDLRRWVSEPKPGVYAVDVRAGSSRDARRLAVTDMQLVVKRGRDPRRWAGQAWALDTRTGAPLPGVTLELVRPTGTAAATCRTDREGGCGLQGPLGEHPSVLMARRGDDVSFVDLDRGTTRDADAETWGATAAPDGWTVAPWTDRGVYRPGDAVQLAAVVRGPARKAPPAGHPVQLVVEDARQRTVLRRVARTDAAGLVAWTVPVPPEAPTGRWQAQLRIGGETVARLGLPVEAVVPERLDVVVRPVAEVADEAHGAGFTVQARYLFGGSAEGARADVRCRFLPQRLGPAVDGVQFGRAPGPAVELGTVETTLGAGGRATVTCPPVPGPGQTGRVQAEVAVHEGGGGRVSRGRAALTWRGVPFALGLIPPTGPVRANAPLEVAGAALTWAGHPLPDGPVTVRLVRTDPVMGWRLDPHTGVRRRTHTVRREVLAEQTVDTVAGRFRATLTPTRAGEAFSVEVERAAVRAAVEVSGTLGHDPWAWAHGGDDGHRPWRTDGPPPAAKVRVTPPGKVEPGREAVATLHTPFAGRALLTVEVDRVLSARWITVRAGENRWPFTLKRFSPNVYLSALVVRGDASEGPPGWRPQRAVGTVSVPVHRGPRVLRPTVAAPDVMRPGETLVVTLDAGRPGAASAVVAAVDEGLLQLTGFETPDPNEALFARRALGVRTWDTWGWGLQPSAPRHTSAVGGGAGASAAQPAVVEPVALWAGPVTLGPDGRGEVRLQVPAYQGRLRVMAVVADAQRVGSAEAAVVVRDPLGLTVSTPLSLIEGDEAVVPAFVHNSTGDRQAVTVQATAQGGAALRGPVTETVTLAPGEGAPVLFKLAATGREGQAAVVVSAQAGGHRSTLTKRLALRPRGVPTDRVTRVTLAAGEVATLSPDPGFLPGTERWRVLASATPGDDAFRPLRGLIDYPHGCLEQTSSRLRPLLALGDLAPDLAADGARSLAPMVQAGVARLWQMQTADGGLAYWPGGAEPHPWGSAHAATLLLDAKAAGHPVDPDRLDQLLGWLSRRLSVGGLDPLTTAWAHAALARAGRPQTARLRRLVEALPSPLVGRDRERAALLWAALHRAGDRRHAGALQALVAEAEVDGDRAVGGFWSGRRGQAVAAAEAVRVLGALDGLTPGLAPLVTSLRADQLTTPELGWTLAAVGRWRQAKALAGPAPTLRQAGAELAPVRPGARVWAATADPTTVQAGDAPTYLTAFRRGVVAPEHAWTGAEGLRVERAWLDAEGQPVDPATVPLGRLVFSRLTVHNPGAVAVPHVALEEPLPAGVTVEPGRLGRVATPAWAAGAPLWHTTHVDARDTHFRAYGRLPARSTVQVIHALRATAAGNFHRPGVSVEAMYDPALRARTKADTLTVRPRFAERI